MRDEFGDQVKVPTHRSKSSVRFRSELDAFSCRNKERINRSLALILGVEINARRIRRPGEGTDPSIEVFRQIPLLSRLAVVQHQPKAVALVSRTLLDAVGDVLAIGRIERSRVASGIV